MDFQQILNHARRGVHQTPTLPGLRHPSIKGSLEFATTDIDTLKKWASDGYAGHNWVSVAKRGAACIFDIDDPDQAQRLAMPNYDDTFVVNSPSPGHKQAYYWHTAASEELGNCNVLGSDGKPVVEFKAHNLTCASPGVKRTDKEPYGEYVPANDLPVKLIPQEMVDWLKKNSSKKKTYSRRTKESVFHPDFDRYDWLDHNELSTTGAEKIVAGVLYVELLECPFVGRAHEGQFKGSFKCCITFGNRIGFKCMAGGCQDKDINDLKEFLSEEHDIEEYPYLIYVEDDDDLLFNSPSFSIADADTPEAQSPEAVVAFLNTPDPLPDLMDVGDESDIKCTDMGNGKRLARLCGYEIAYCRERGVWFVWNGKTWAEDQGNIDITRKAKSVAKTILIEAAQEPDEAKSDALVNWAMQSQSKTRIEAMIAMSKSEGTIAKSVHDFDKQEHLFNCDNGVIDLRTGELLPHDPRHMMTQITRFKYLGLNTSISDAKDFWKFLCWAQPEEAIRLFLQRSFGYSMWGTAREPAVIFLWGDGNNGKGILLNMLDVILGDYSTPAEFKTFSEMGKIGGGGGHGGHSDDLAGLHKKRAASVDETNKGGRFNEGLLKTVTGGAKTMRVSRKGEKGFDMTPMFTFWFASNHKPKLTDTGKSMRRRIKLVKFLNSVEIGKEDTRLADRIIANEGDILLSWMVQGAVEWYKRGLDTPPSVQEWTSEYFHDEDILQHWLDECTEQGAHFESRSSESYLSFAKFSESNGYFKIDQREFKKRLEQKGFIHKGKNYANVYLGFKVTQHFLEEEPKLTADMVDAVM